MADLSFDAALSVGDPSVLVDSLEQSWDDAPAADVSVDAAPQGTTSRRQKLPRSRSQRGLVLRSLKVDKGWDGWGFFNRVNEIYFMSVGFDFSGEPPILLPPKEVPAEGTYPANGSWDDHLTDTKNQTTITLAEL